MAVSRGFGVVNGSFFSTTTVEDDVLAGTLFAMAGVATF
jgi:hypothetical protein